LYSTATGARRAYSSRQIVKVVSIEPEPCRNFEQYIEAVGKEEEAIAQFDAYAALLAHLYDALEMGDLRAGEIHNRATAEWLLNETLTLMEGLTDKRIASFVKTVRNHQPQLLTFLDWIAVDLPDWQARLADLLPGGDDADAFQRTVARHWRLQQMLINGHARWRTTADETALELSLWTEEQPDLDAFASAEMGVSSSQHRMLCKEERWSIHPLC